MAEEKICPLPELPDDDAPLLLPHHRARTREARMTGRLTIVGLGPGDPRWLTPAAPRRWPPPPISSATGLMSTACRERAGSAPSRIGQPRRARPRALRARSCRQGRPRRGRLRRRSRRLRHGCRGVRGARERRSGLARARHSRRARHHRDARGAPPALGAPLGGDFCAMSLSDNLKPWDVDRARG